LTYFSSSEFRLYFFTFIIISRISQENLSHTKSKKAGQRGIYTILSSRIIPVTSGCTEESIKKRGVPVFSERIYRTGE